MNLTLFIRGPPQARGQDPTGKPIAENICRQSWDYRLQSERILTQAVSTLPTRPAISVARYTAVSRLLAGV